jgi:7-cyano-7-deazaguanine reductase
MNLLGKPVNYTEHHSLFPIARRQGRDALFGDAPLPFDGFDLWHAFELSWLNDKGKPVVATAEFVFPATSPHIIESKSLKLFLNDLHQRRFSSANDVKAFLEPALSHAAGADARVALTLSPPTPTVPASHDAVLLDAIDCAIDVYDYTPDLLRNDDGIATETLYSELLKSNCPVTGQPDWARLTIRYSGHKINRESLLRYLVSFRHHNEFHEQCVERVFCDITRHCAPDTLSVWAQYTRRGGLDICPFRSNEKDFTPDLSLVWRQ